MSKKKTNVISIGGRDLSIAYLNKPKEFTPIDPVTGDPMMGNDDTTVVFSIYSVKSPVVVNAIHAFKRDNPDTELTDLLIMQMATDAINGGIELNGEVIDRDNMQDFYDACRNDDGYAWIFNQVYKEILMGDFSPKK